MRLKKSASKPSSNTFSSPRETLHESEADNPDAINHASGPDPIEDTEIPRLEDPSLNSEVSSLVPTSARLSIATTHQSTNADGNTANINDALAAILNNPGWEVAAQAAALNRRNSLMSTRSLQPTLPPYEDHGYHLPVSDGGAGPSSLRPQIHTDVQPAIFTDAKMRSANVSDDNGNYADNDSGEHDPPRRASPHTPDDPENALSAHYSQIVRTIDSRYTSELERWRNGTAAMHQQHAEEMAVLRNNVDAAYRGVLKRRDQEVEKAKEEMASRSEELERDVLRWKAEYEHRLAVVTREAGEEVERVKRDAEEKAGRVEEEYKKQAERGRHVVEDEWERRWLERMKLSDEEAARREDKALGERDEEWIGTLCERLPPHLVDEIAGLMLDGDREE